MKYLLIKILFLWLCMMILTNYYSCVQEDEETAFQKASDLNNAAERITAFEKFTRDFPESGKLRTAHLRLFKDYLELNNVNAALTSGSAYLSYFPEENRMSHYNRIAWSLAEKGVGLDSAKVYATRAVQLARDINYRYLFTFLDTYALTIFKQGDAVQAEAVQNEAIKGNENDSDLLRHLAIYQHANGKKPTALKSMAKSLLFGRESQGIDDFQKWLQEEAPQESQRINLTKSIIYETINENLSDDASPLQRSQAAVLLARCDIDLARAEQWAAQASANVNENTSSYDEVQIYTNLAQVYKAQKKYSKMLETLKGFESTAMPYDFEFWSILAQAYEQNGQTEKAIDAYVNGSLLRKDNKVIAALNMLGLNNDQIDLYIEQTKEEMINFDPGHYKVGEQNTKRVVLTELFTGSECAPCVGADLALDKIAEYYPRSVMALLEYHVHIPRPDALTNNSSEDRYQYYAQQHGRIGTPTVFINGVDKHVGAGPELVKRNMFQVYKTMIDKYVNHENRVELDCSGEIEGDNIYITVDVATNPSDKIKANLHIALVEKRVDFTGGNGVTKHAFVVRYLVDGAQGSAVALNDGKASISKEINLPQLNQNLKSYLDEFAANPPARYRKRFTGWNERPETVDETNLALIAWLQNNTSKEVFQAKYIDF